VLAAVSSPVGPGELGGHSHSRCRCRSACCLAGGPEPSKMRGQSCGRMPRQCSAATVLPDPPDLRCVL